MAAFPTFVKKKYVKLRHNTELKITAQRSTCYNYEGWNFNSGNYLFTTDTK